MLLGSVFSMCSTVASRLYLSGQTTRMEYIGGIRLPGEVAPPGTELLVSSPDADLESLPDSGKASFMGGLNNVGSGMNEEADERSDRRLLVRAAELELADDTEGDSRPTSGEVE